MTDLLDISDHMARSCECGCVRFNLLRSGNIECDDCGEKQPNLTWRDFMKKKNNVFDMTARIAALQAKGEDYPDNMTVHKIGEGRLKLYDGEQYSVAVLSDFDPCEDQTPECGIPVSIPIPLDSLPEVITALAKVYERYANEILSNPLEHDDE